MFTKRLLFGGAISCEIPSAWRDVSDIRQVPDHQECWQEMDGAALVVEILQRQDSVSNDAAASYFFNDLAESNGVVSADQVRFQNTQTTTTHCPNVTPVSSSSSEPQDGSNNTIITTTCGGIGYQKVAVGRDYDFAGNRRLDQEIRWIRVDLCVVRLATVETDLLITLSTPVLSNGGTTTPSEPSLGPPPLDPLDAFSDVFVRILSTLQIRDWGLFG